MPASEGASTSIVPWLMLGADEVNAKEPDFPGPGHQLLGVSMSRVFNSVDKKPITKMLETPNVGMWSCRHGIVLILLSTIGFPECCWHVTSWAFPGLAGFNPRKRPVR
jgi:hypothetical protein